MNAAPSRVPGSRQATVALIVSFLSFALMVTWNILVMALPGLVALILGYFARRRLGAGDDVARRRAHGRAATAMALGAIPVVLAVVTAAAILVAGLS